MNKKNISEYLRLIDQYFNHRDSLGENLSSLYHIFADFCCRAEVDRWRLWLPIIRLGCRRS